MAIASRILSSGSQLVNGDFDEVSLTAGSVAFNGTSQYLTIANNAAFDLATGTPDWTIECWFNTSLAGSQQILVQKDGISGSRQSQYDIMINASNQIQGVLSPATSSTGNQNFTSSVTVTTNTWYHVAMVRNGSNITIFLNGAIVVGPTALTITMGNNTGPLSIGANGTGASYLNGSISNVRIVKGTAVYTAAFTPSQSILPSITNTQLLLNVINSTDFIKDSSPNAFTLTNNGTATWTAAGPFNQSPSGAIAFNGTSQYLSLPSGQSAFQLGTGDFTVECWMYVTSLSAAIKQIFDNWNSPATNAYQFYITAANQLEWQIYTQNSPASATLSILANTWTHVAWCRTGGNVLTFINGVLKDTTAVTNSADGNATNPTIGADNAGGSNYFPGYITNFRMVKGTAVYTASFTPPTTPLTAISGTSLLLLAANASTFITDSSVNNFTLTNNGTATYIGNTPLTGAPAQRITSSGTLEVLDQFDEISFVPGSWTLSGSQGVTVGNSSVFALPGDFTVEFFFYLSSVPSTEIDFWESQTSTTFRILKRGASSGLSYDAYGGTSYLIVADASIPVNQWNHVAVSRTGTTVQAYFNGTRTINQTDATSFGAPTANYSVGCRAAGTNGLAGSISNFRLVKGAGMYTGATIPVPSAPLGNVTGTQLLLPTPYTGGAFFDYSTNNFTVTQVGAPVSGSGDPFTVNTPQRLTSTGILQVAADFDEVSLTAGAIAFNGTSQYLSTAANTALDLPGDFTIESWVYPTGSKVTADVVASRWISGDRVWLLNFGATSNLVFQANGATLITYSFSITYNTWYHVAVTRSGTTVTLWLNGVSVGTGTSSYNFTSATRPLLIGRNGDSTDGTQDWLGYISNFRIVKGTAVYTTTFTPPQSVLPAVTNTSLLLNVVDSASFITDNSPNAFALTNNGTATWTASGPFNS